jgi:hypothetical protein
MTITFDPNDCETEWRKRDKHRKNLCWQGRIITYMAGAAAEIEFFGHCDGRDEDDRHQIEIMAEELLLELPPGVGWNTREPRLRAMTRMLVRRHRTRIERVAQALLTHRTQSAEDLDRLVGRSVNDVKANEPPWVIARRNAFRAESMQDASLNSNEFSLLNEEVERVPVEIRNEFDARYERWKQTWRRADIVISSDPTEVRHSPEFLHLTSMGPSILPLVVAKLAHREDFFALQLYDVLQSDPSLRVGIAQDETIYGGEQFRAIQVVRRWLSK